MTKKLLMSNDRSTKIEQELYAERLKLKAIDKEHGKIDRGLRASLDHLRESVAESSEKAKSLEEENSTLQKLIAEQADQLAKERASRDELEKVYANQTDKQLQKLELAERDHAREEQKIKALRAENDELLRQGARQKDYLSNSLKQSQALEKMLLEEKQKSKMTRLGN